LQRTRLAVQQRRLKFGIPVRSPFRHQWSEAEMAMLGTESDRVVAERLGLEVSTVVYQRMRRDIPTANPRQPWTEAEEALLGTRPDRDLARKWGRTELGVAVRRRELGIKVFRKKRQARP
jgi:hypothetical protein